MTSRIVKLSRDEKSDLREILKEGKVELVSGIVVLDREYTDKIRAAIRAGQHTDLTAEFLYGVSVDELEEEEGN